MRDSNQTIDWRYNLTHTIAQRRRLPVAGKGLLGKLKNLVKDKVHKVTHFIKNPGRIPGKINKIVKQVKNHGVDYAKWKLYEEKKHDAERLKSKLENLDVDKALNDYRKFLEQTSGQTSGQTKPTIDYSDIHDISDDEDLDLDKDGKVETSEVITDFRIPTLTEYFKQQDEKFQEETPTYQVFNKSLNMYVPKTF